MDRVAVVDMPEQEWDRVMRINLKGVFSARKQRQST